MTRPAAPRHVPLLSAAVVVLLAANVLLLGSARPEGPKAAVAAAVGLPVPDAATAAEVAPPPPSPTPQPPAPTPLPAPAPAPTPAPAPQELAAAATGPAFPERIRGVWVHVLDDVLLSRASIARMLDQVVAGGGNTVVVEVGRRHDAYWDSSFLPRGNDPGFEPGLDVLAEVIAGADARGLSVHAWYTAMPAWTPETANNPTPHNWTFTQHGRDVPPADSWLTFDAAGAPSDFLDPGHPAVQDLVVATAAELAAYDVDAIHLDYLRYPGQEFGYNPVALARFQAETGRTDVPAPTDPQFSDWRRQQTTDTLRRINQAVDAVDPTVGISAALIAWGEPPSAVRSFEQTPAHARVFQPWPQWMAEGLVDVAMPMLYFREGRHAGYHRGWTQFAGAVRQATGVMTAPGQGSWLNAPEESIAQMAATATLTDGEVLFSYQETVAGGAQELLPALRTSLWAQ